MLNVGVIGYGYWGPNIVRNLQGLNSVKVAGSATRVRRACSAPSGHTQACR